jgi:hypothetical protein
MMSFILRWLLILILAAFVGQMLAAQPLLGLIQTHSGVDLTLLKTAWSGLAHHNDWVEATLWYAAAAFLLIAVIRLARRTQAFWMWLLAFAFLGARWGLSLRAVEGGAVGFLQGLTLERFQPALLVANPPLLSIVLLIKLLIIGLLILVVDHDDKAYWDRHAG